MLVPFPSLSIPSPSGPSLWVENPKSATLSTNCLSNMKFCSLMSLWVIPHSCICSIDFSICLNKVLQVASENLFEILQYWHMSPLSTNSRRMAGHFWISPVVLNNSASGRKSIILTMCLELNFCKNPTSSLKYFSFSWTLMANFWFYLSAKKTLNLKMMYLLCPALWSERRQWTR